MYSYCPLRLHPFTKIVPSSPACAQARTRNHTTHTDPFAQLCVLPGLIRTAVLKLTASGRGFERNIAILTREIFAVIDEVSID